MGIKEDNLKLICSNELGDWVLKSEKSAFYETIFGFIVLVLFGFLMYQRSSGNLLWFLLGILGLMFFFSIYTYGGTIRRARIINSTVKSLKINKDTLLVKTFSYNIMGIKSVVGKEVEISRDLLVVNESDYPIMDKKVIQGNVFVISGENQGNYYVLPQFFPNDIKNYLIL